MERNGDDDILEQDLAVDEDDCEAPILNSTVFLDHVGEVLLTHNSDGLSWKSLTSFDNDGSSCLRFKFSGNLPSEIKFSDVYAVELTNYGSIRKVNRPNVGNILLGRETLDSEMFRFMVHSFQKSKTQPNVWVLAVYTFGHKDLPTCEMWVNRLNASLSLQVGRPKNLLVFVNPMSGKNNACSTWETVAAIFARAKIEAKVVVTKRAGHAFDVLTSTTRKELNSYDGVIAVGGDGFFNEILNGYLSSRYKAPYPPAPADFVHSVGGNDCSLVHNPGEKVAEASDQNDYQYSRLPSSQHNGSGLSNFFQDSEFAHHNKWFRFGIIPAGSTDAIVMCTTGARDPVTSALHIVLGKRVCLDIAQIVSWRETASSKVEPRVRYAASFAGYGFYGDVITESEKYRWMGPKRYDYAGTKVFLRHRSYEAEVAYLEVESGKTNTVPDRGRRFGRLQMSGGPDKSERVICRTNCNICNKKSSHSTPYSHPKETRWLRSKGCFLSVGAAIISNRNQRAPDGLVVDAHLSDGLLHLILIKDCPHALYLWHLTELARKGGNPLNFEFVEHIKTPAFTFTSSGNDSVWNLDGELFRAHQLSAQVFQGLISLFASGPEV